MTGQRLSSLSLTPCPSPVDTGESAISRHISLTDAARPPLLAQYSARLSSSSEASFQSEEPASPVFSVPDRDPSRTSSGLEKTIPSLSGLRSKKFTDFYILLTALAPVVAFFIWLGHSLKEHREIQVLVGAGIGGRLSQFDAKAIDFVCGAVLAPLFMVPLNYLWFGKARTCAINEQGSSRGISLSVLAEASNTSNGTYDLVKLCSLFSGKTWRLLLLGILALFAALARTSFANMIAYESYTEAVSISGSVEVRMLQDEAISQSSLPDDILNYPNRLNFNPAQITETEIQVYSLLKKL